MNNNAGMYVTLVAVGLAVIAMFMIGFMDRARDPGPIEKVTQEVADK